MWLEVVMNVGQVAALAGLSVRTLHHWDAIGLLMPSGRSPSGYRSYAESDLVRLQQVLTYRELGFGLAQIATLLDDPTVDALDHLRRQHELLTDRIARLQGVAALVERAVEARRMGIALTPQELREVFGEQDPTEHLQEAEERWGETDAYRQSQRRTSGYSKQDWLRIQSQAGDLEQRFAQALAEGEPADGERARALAEEHRRHIEATYYDCGYEMHRALADMYVGDARFTAHYEQVAPGLAQYLHDAVHANAEARS